MMKDEKEIRRRGRWRHTSYLSRTPRTLSVEQKCSCGAILLHMKFFRGHVEQNYFTWQSFMLHMTKPLVMWSNFGVWINDKLLLLPNFGPCDKFTMCAVLLWFTLFWRRIHFVAIYALLCGAKNNQQILSVEHKWQIWCMHQPLYQWCWQDLCYHRHHYLCCHILYG